MEERKKGLSIAALILGILSMLCCCIGFPFAIIGLILAIIALVKNSGAKGAAIVGLITSIITLIISTLVTVTLIPFAPYFEDIQHLYTIFIFMLGWVIFYFEDMGEMVQNAATVVEEYEEDGAYPEVIDRMIEDGVFGEEEAKIFMDSFCDGFKQGSGVQ